MNPLNDPRETFKFGEVTVPVDQGMLHFKSKEDFQLVIDGIVEGKYHPEKNGVHFTAMQRTLDEIPAETLDQMDEDMVAEKYNSILTIAHEGEDAFLKPVVDSRPLRTLINKDGILIIEDTVYHFAYEKTYVMPKSQFATPEKIIANAIKVYEVVRKSGGDSVIGGVQNCIDYYGGTKREEQRKMMGELLDYNNTVYQEISIGVENYDKNFAHIWKRDEATNIWLQCDFNVQYLDSDQGWVTISDNIDEYRFHDDEIEWIVISRVLNGNTLGNVSWSGSDMTFKVDEKDDSEVRHDDNWDEAECNITE